MKNTSADGDDPRPAVLNPLMAETPVSDDKMLRIMCPNLACQRILTVPVHARGKLVRCRTCSMTIRIPSKKQPAESEAD